MIAPEMRGIPRRHQQGPADTGSHPWVQEERRRAVPRGEVHVQLALLYEPSPAPAASPASTIPLLLLPAVLTLHRPAGSPTGGWGAPSCSRGSARAGGVAAGAAPAEL